MTVHHLPIMRAFTGLRPAAKYAADVAAPPYDVVSFSEAKALSDGRPWSFFHISRPEIDMPKGTDPYAPEVYAKGAENLRHMIDKKILVRDKIPHFYIYRIQSREHCQTGIVGAASVTSYDNNRIRRHELTRPIKENDRVRQIEAVNAHTGPVLLTHYPHKILSDIIERSTLEPFDYCVTDTVGANHLIWPVHDPKSVSIITQIFESMPALYIADGHHRSAAASRVCSHRRQKSKKKALDAPYESFLAVSFPSDEMRILPYNRVVKNLGKLNTSEFLKCVKEFFVVQPSNKPVNPQTKTHFGMYLDGAWYLLMPKKMPASDSLIANLDVNLLADRLLKPVLGIHDPRTDLRIDFVGGDCSLDDLTQRVNNNGWAVAFTLCPISISDLMLIAEKGKVMPPKSTWFDPKLMDGLVSNPLE